MVMKDFMLCKMYFWFLELRSNYIAAWHAAKMMVPAKQGLIVNVSSAGGLRYLFNVAYGVGKAGVSDLFKFQIQECGSFSLRSFL